MCFFVVYLCCDIPLRILSFCFVFLDHDFGLGVMGSAAIGPDDPAFHGHPRSRRNSREDVEAGGSVGVDQVPEPGGIGFAGGFGLVEPEVY